MLYYSLKESLLFLEISSSKSDVTPNVRAQIYECVPPPNYRVCCANVGDIANKCILAQQISYHIG